MVYMVAGGFKPVHATADAQIEHRDDVRQRQSEQQQRQGCAGGRVSHLHQIDDGKAQRKAQELAAGITHEHACRVRVVAQKAGNATDGRQGDVHHHGAVGEIAQEGDDHHAQQGLTASQTIETI